MPFGFAAGAGVWRASCAGCDAVGLAEVRALGGPGEMIGSGRHGRARRYATGCHASASSSPYCVQKDSTSR